MSLPKTQKRANDAYVRRQQSRTRRAKAILDEFIDKSLPPLPAVPGIPGWTRWLKAIENIEIQMTMIADEMGNYRQCRSKKWKESMQCYFFDKKLEDLRRITDEVVGWPELDPDPAGETQQQQYDRLCDHLKRDVTLQKPGRTDHASA